MFTIIWKTERKSKVVTRRKFFKNRLARVSREITESGFEPGTQSTIIKNYRTFTVVKPGNTLEQVERLIAAATNPRDALLVHIPSRTGIRVSELIGKGFKTWDFENRASSSR